MEGLKEFVETVGGHRGVWAFLLGLGFFYGILKPFEKLDSILSKDLRETITLWLLEAKSTENIKSWPETFPQVFDAIFGKKLWSRRCFNRSSLVSFVGVAVMWSVFVVVNPEEFHNIRARAPPADAISYFFIVFAGGGFLNLFRIISRCLKRDSFWTGCAAPAASAAPAGSLSIGL